MLDGARLEGMLLWRIEKKLLAGFAWGVGVVAVSVFVILEALVSDVSGGTISLPFPFPSAFSSASLGCGSEVLVAAPVGGEVASHPSSLRAWTTTLPKSLRAEPSAVCP